MRVVAAILVAALWAAAVSPSRAFGQSIGQRGFVQGHALLYPQTTPQDDRQAGADLLARYEVAGRAWPWLAFSAGVDARIDTLEYVEREWRLDWDDRSLRRPAFGVRRLSAALIRGGFSLELGRQLVRWGKADVLNPTDRFAPKDFVEVVSSDFMAVWGARLTYERGGRTIDALWVPRFTPSRVPLPGTRWAAVPETPASVPVVDRGAVYPGGSQFGARWNQVGSLFEYSVSYYDGFNHLPLFEGRFVPAPGQFEVWRAYPRIRSVGGDVAWPLKWFTVKGEVSYLRSLDAKVDNYGLYAVQVERQSGEWFIVGGYAGEFVTEKRPSATFAPDRGLAKAFLGRAQYTIDAARTFSIEGVVRQNGDGVWLTASYSQSVGQHWRATAAGTLIGGQEDDFLGQYNRNSNLAFTLRYSF